MPITGGAGGPEGFPRPEAVESGVASARETTGEVRPVPERRAQSVEGLEGPSVAPVYQAAAPAAVTKDPVLKRVEEILEEDLAEAYLQLPPDLRAKFKERGEDVAAAVRRMMTGAKVRAKDVLRLIVSWLRLIPHVNRFFLEQEAKIKTDRIVALAERQKEKGL